MSKRKTIEEYDALRLIVTILVVLSHSGYYVIRSNYGGCDYSEFAADMGAVYKSFMIIANMLYCFHMPLFMALSGALYRVALDKRGRGTWKNVISAKFLRLIIPFLCVSLMYSIPIKYISQYFSASHNIISDIIVGQLLVQGNTHLWYLSALFLIFIIFYWIIPILSKHPVMVVTVLYGMNFLGNHISIKIVSYVMIYLLWFCMGYLFEEKRKLLNDNLSWKTGLICGGGFITLYALDRYTIAGNYWASHFLLSTLLTLSGSICIYCLSLWISGTKFKENAAYQIVLGASFGIYLYSDSLNYPILKIATTLLGNELFNNNMYAVLFLLIRFLLTLMISLWITLFLKRLHFKYVV